MSSAWTFEDAQIPVRCMSRRGNVKCKFLRGACRGVEMLFRSGCVLKGLSTRGSGHRNVAFYFCRFHVIDFRSTTESRHTLGSLSKGHFLSNQQVEKQSRTSRHSIWFVCVVLFAFFKLSHRKSLSWNEVVFVRSESMQNKYLDQNS